MTGRMPSPEPHRTTRPHGPHPPMPEPGANRRPKAAARRAGADGPQVADATRGAGTAVADTPPPQHSAGVIPFAVAA